MPVVDAEPLVPDGLCVIVTCAPETGAPFASTTVPRIEASVCCAMAGVVDTAIAVATAMAAEPAASIDLNFIVIPKSLTAENGARPKIALHHRRNGP